MFTTLTLGQCLIQAEVLDVFRAKFLGVETQGEWCEAHFDPGLHYKLVVVFGCVDLETL